ncbi:MAG: universal stress protein [Actinobacteria bacterium]|jgi:nucleotide-binding universal stress UspA family protein|nr:universal stress protein [Actinomycetota bacterium]
MYERIVLPFDGAHRALAPLPYAQQLAHTWQARLEILHVATDIDLPAEAQPAGHDVRVIQAPDPAQAIGEYMRASDPPGLLCMASRGRSAAGEALFGTVTGQVIRHLNAPLVVTGPKLRAPTHQRDLRRLLVCLDGSATSASIVPTARTWATELGLELVLIHVTYPLGDPSIGEITVPVETRVVADELRRTADELTQVGLNVRWHLVEDTQPASGIIHQAAHRDADLIVMATHGRTGLARILTGSVTTDVIRNAPVPILTLRPEHLK